MVAAWYKYAKRPNSRGGCFCDNGFQPRPIATQAIVTAHVSVCYDSFSLLIPAKLAQFCVACCTWQTTNHASRVRRSPEPITRGPASTARPRNNTTSFQFAIASQEGLRNAGRLEIDLRTCEPFRRRQSRAGSPRTTLTGSALWRSAQHEAANRPLRQL